MSALSAAQVDAYRRDGFLFPLPVFSAAETLLLRQRLEAAEADAKLGEERVVRQTLPITHAWAWDLARDRRIVEPVASLLGRNVLLWSMDWFIKAPGPAHVTYHQDATYWGLKPHHVVTAWIALSDAGPAAGPMRFLPGSHRGPVVEQEDTFAPNNLLSRGQRVKAAVDNRKTVLAPLAAGEMSLHHVRVIHGSAPNRAADRRIGMALRYCATDVRQTKVDGDHAVLARGADAHGHFRLIPRPREVSGEREQQLAGEYRKTRNRALMGDARRLAERH